MKAGIYNNNLVIICTKDYKKGERLVIPLDVIDGLKKNAVHTNRKTNSSNTNMGNT